MKSFALCFVICLLLCVSQQTSASSISLKWVFPNTESGANVSYGDPHRWSDELNRTFISQVFSNNSGTYLLTTSPASGAVHLLAKLTDSIFPTLSGWIAHSPAFPLALRQSPRVCPEPVCFYIGTMRGVMAVAAKSGKVLWTTEIFQQEQQVPGHATYTSWKQNEEGIVWVTFENGVASSQIYLLSTRDGRFTPIQAADSSSARSDVEVGYTLIWPIESLTSDIDPLFASAGVYGAYRLETKQVGIVCRGIVSSSDSGKNQFPPKVVTLWSNWSLSYSPPGLWDNPNLDVDLVDESFKSGLKQNIFAYLEPTTSHRIVNRVSTATGKFIWHEDTFADVPDYDTYAYLGDFFRLMVRKNNTLQLEKMNGNSGDKVWEYQQGNFSDSSAILLVGSGIVSSFGLSSGIIFVVDETSGNYLGEIDLSAVCGGGLTTGVTVAAGTETLLVFGDLQGRLYGYSITL